MNSDTPLQLLQQTFHVGIGFSASILETLQDPQKRNQTLSELQEEMKQKIDEWSKKGEITEQEARIFLEQWLNQSSTSKTSSGYTSTTSTKGNVGQEIQQLTEKIISLREEIETLRQQKKS